MSVHYTHMSVYRCYWILELIETEESYDEYKTKELFEGKIEVFKFYILS